MKDYIARLSPRERTIFGLSGLALLGLLIHALILEPYYQKQSSLTEQLDQTISDLEWMESEVHRLPVAAMSGEAIKFEGSLANLIDKEVRSQKLDANLAQMTPVGTDEIRIRFAGIAFDKLLNFIARINNQGLSVKDLRINASDKRAEVDASLVLNKNG
ncbi:MAG: type II secretion system protein GspM [Gammaproteobacteria bacterium]